MSDKSRGNHQDAHDRLPFQQRGHPGRMSVPRILEAVILAVVTALVTAAASALATQAVLQERLDNMERSLDDIKREQQRMRSDLYAPRFERGVMRYGAYEDGHGPDESAN